MKRISESLRRKPDGHVRGSASTGRQLVLGTLCIMISLCLASSAKAFSADEGKKSIEEARMALEKWIQTKDLISKEKRDFELKKEILSERIELVRHEMDSLHKKIADAENSIAEADKKRQEMLQENNQLRDASDSLQSALTLLENHTRQLITRLPDPIRIRVKPLSQRLPENPDETKLSVSERFQNVVGILNEVNKFNREITVNSEVRDLPDGSSVEVAAVYIGIGQAYYASVNGSFAGIGTATDEGWVWKQDNQAAPQIADAIAILKNEKVASFVLLPVEIQ